MFIIHYSHLYIFAHLIIITFILFTKFNLCHFLIFIFVFLFHPNFFLNFIQLNYFNFLSNFFRQEIINYFFIFIINNLFIIRLIFIFIKSFLKFSQINFIILA